MRIAIVHQDLYFQGGQCVAAKLANGLFARGHVVDVIVSQVHADIQKNNPSAKPFALEKGIRLHVLPLRRAAFNVFALAWLIRKLKPDVIMPQVPMYNECAVLAKIVGFLRTPIVYTEHCLMGPTTDRVLRFCLKRDARIVCVSEGVKDFVRQSLGFDSGKVVRIYNPSLSERPVDRETDIAPCMREKDRYTFVSTGEMNTLRKGFDVIVKAFAKVHAVEPETRLVLFGRGSRQEGLKRLADELGVAGGVVFAGFTSNPIGNMSYADAFVFGSRNETFGLVLVEALSAGLQVVSTDCVTGPSEILKGGRIGQLVPVNDDESMFKAMLKLVRGEWHQTEQFDPHEYLESTAIDHYEQLLKNVVGGAK